VSRFPVPVTKFPALEPLLAGHLWHDWEEQNLVFPLSDLLAAVRYVRLKPKSSCRLVVFGDTDAIDDDPPPGFLLHLYSDLDRARNAFDKRSYRHPVRGESAHEPFLCEKYAVVGVPFPNDPRIPGLRHLYRPYRLRSALVELLPDYPADRWRIKRNLIRKQLLAYKPGRRAVYRIDVTLDRLDGSERVSVPLQVKLESPEGCEAIHRNAAGIHAAIPGDAGWRVPRMRGKVVERSMIATEWIEGANLDVLIEKPERALPALRLTGSALAGFHSIEADLPFLPSLPDEAESLRSLGHDLAILLPGEERPIAALADRLATRIPELAGSRMTIVHGDFHLGQVILEGGMPVLLDLDGAGRGRVATDLGFFLAHLEELGVGPVPGKTFLEGYSQGGGECPDPDLLTLATAAGLFRRTVVPFRRLMVDWPERIRLRLARVEGLLASVSV